MAIVDGSSHQRALAEVYAPDRVRHVALSCRVR
jgi:hypothetical protein